MRWQMKPCLKPRPAKLMVPKYLLAILLLLALPIPSVAAESLSSLDQTEIRAQLSPVRYATLAAGMAGTISAVSVREGELFKQGQVLVEFDCKLQAAQLQKANAQLAGAQNSYAGSQRMADLNAIGSVELTNSKVQVDIANADVAYLNAIIERCSIRAPYAGSVSGQLVREQEFVQVGQPLLEIFDDSELVLEFIAPSHWLRWFSPGYPFHVRIDDTGKLYPAKLSYTVAKVDPMSQSVKAVAVIDGKYKELMAGMSGYLQLAPSEQ